MRLLGCGLFVAVLADHALDGVGEHEVGHLVAGHEGAGEGAAVDGYEEDFFWKGRGRVSVWSLLGGV